MKLNRSAHSVSDVDGEVAIRIISARKAEKNEGIRYEEGTY